MYICIYGVMGVKEKKAYERDRHRNNQVWDKFQIPWLKF